MFRIILLVLLCANIAFSFPANPSNNDYWQQDGALYQYNSASNKWKKLHKVLYRSPFEFSSDLTDAGLQTAFTAIGATETELFIDAQYTITDNLTVPANIKLNLASGASFSVNAGFTLTINGDFEAPDETVFIGLGNVSLANSALQQIKAVWYGVVSTGVVADYLVKAINNAGGKQVLLSDGTFDVSNLTDYTITQDVNLKGSANSILDGQDNAKARMILANDTDNIIDWVQFVDFKNAVECLSIDFVTFNHIDSVIIKNSKFSSSENGIYLRCQLDKVIVSDSEFTDMTQTVDGLFATGIWVGAEAVDVADMSTDISISGNTISNITHTFNGDGTERPLGILIIGKSVNINHNNLSYIKNASTTLAIGAHGIYTKSINTIIDGNNLLNAGNGDASIVLKGEERGNMVALTEAYAHVVSNNNIIYNDSDYVTQLTAGIMTYTSNSLIEGNYIEGTRHSAIRTNLSQTDFMDNIVIQNNNIMLDESYASIYVATNGENYVISNNTSYGARPVAANIGVSVRHPIQVIGFGTTKGIIISGNVIQEDYNDFTGIISNHAIDIEPATFNLTDINVSNNSFIFSNKPVGYYYGLELDSNTIPVVNVSVMNNVFDGGLSPFSIYTKGQFVNNFDPYTYSGDNFFDMLTGYNRSLVSDTGNETALKVAYTTNKLAGNDTGIEIIQTDTASPGTSLLIDARVGASSKFKVNNDGEANLSGISGDGAGKAVCIKADGNLGTCTDVVGAGGSCTCS